MGLCSCRTILYNKRGVFRCLSSVCWEQSHRHTYGVFWPLTRRGSGRFISIQVVNHKTLIHNASCSQQRWGRNRQTPEYGGVRGGGGSKRAESSLVIWRGKRGCLLDFRSVKYFSPRFPYVRGPPDGELGTTYRVTCPINSFIFRLENKFPLWGYVPVALFYITSEAYSAVWALFAGNNHTDTHMAYFGRLLEEEVAVLFQSKL